MKVTTDTIVRELAGKHPQTLEVLEKHGIDYCCGGGKPLKDAASDAGANTDELVADLQAALGSAPTGLTSPDWNRAGLGELVYRILNTHHTYMKKALPKIADYLAKVLRAHGAAHGEMLKQVDAIYQPLRLELESHLEKEEQILFPYVIELDAATRDGLPKPDFCCGSVEGPISQMMHEHENAGEALDNLRKATNNYTLPPDTCPTFAALFNEFQRMEKDLHTHIHLENNILFPRLQESR
ncbi:MAG: iron-sulfur cluster repair di-iron protein [Verrucomicrobia bacterium]|nr:iron-sulfur cluster repair di-iron protein [Verrucomicrobiota bacterium]